jgi:hypothetical protein
MLQTDCWIDIVGGMMVMVVKLEISWRVDRTAEGQANHYAIQLLVCMVLSKRSQSR